MKYIIQILIVVASFKASATSANPNVSHNGFSTSFLATVPALHKSGLRTTQTTGSSESGYFELSGTETFKLIGLIGFCCLAVVVVVTKYRKGMKSDQQEYQSEINKTRLRLTALREKQILLAEEFEQNSNKLKDVTEQLESKRQLLTNIKQLVELTSSEQLINSEMKSRFSKIGRNIQYSFHVDQEWHHFRSYFENANEEFLANLKEKFPTLSPNDYKLCVLYKTDSDHERVASIMEISSESARVMKHRLKKKLELPLNQCLSEFLRKFESNSVKKNQPQLV